MLDHLAPSPAHLPAQARLTRAAHAPSSVPCTSACPKAAASRPATAAGSPEEAFAGSSEQEEPSRPSVTTATVTERVPGAGAEAAAARGGRGGREGGRSRGGGGKGCRRRHTLTLASAATAAQGAVARKEQQLPRCCRGGRGGDACAQNDDAVRSHIEGACDGGAQGQQRGRSEGAGGGKAQQGERSLEEATWRGGQGCVRSFVTSVPPLPSSSPPVTRTSKPAPPELRTAAALGCGGATHGTLRRSVAPLMAAAAAPSALRSVPAAMVTLAHPSPALLAKSTSKR